MKIFYKMLTVVLILGIVLDAKPVNRSNVIIKNIHPMSVDRIHCPNCSGITRIYFNNGQWGDTLCRVDAADLLKEDSHILSLLMFAWSTNKKVRIEVNDESRPIDKVCRLTAAFIYD